MKVTKYLSKNLKPVYVGYSKCRHYSISINPSKGFKRTTLKALKSVLLAPISKQGFAGLKAKLKACYKAHKLIVKHNMDHKRLVKCIKLGDKLKEALVKLRSLLIVHSSSFLLSVDTTGEGFKSQASTLGLTVKPVKGGIIWTT